jgi:NAD(P)-dependent dehydrogenase (short-subunit alcohol dehydrogenase family)
MKNDNARRVIVVTGASAGLGRAIAKAFAQTEQARVGLIARGKERLEAAKREIEDAGGEALILQADVADAGAVEAVAEKIESQFGPIDVWVNDAMTSVFSPVKEMSGAEFKRVTEVTYLGVVNGTPSGYRYSPNEIRASPDSLSNRRVRWSGDSVRMTSRVGRTSASIRCPPQAEPSRFPSTAWT